MSRLGQLTDQHEIIGRLARTALALLDAERPDLVVLDAPLRAADPLELLGEIRRRSAVVVVPRPNCPEALSPQAHSEPF